MLEHEIDAIADLDCMILEGAFKSPQDMQEFYDKKILEAMSGKIFVEAVGPLRQMSYVLGSNRAELIDLRAKNRSMENEIELLKAEVTLLNSTLNDISVLQSQVMQLQSQINT